MAKSFDIIWETGPRLGLKLNIPKTEIFWPLCHGSKLCEDLFPSDIGKPILEMKLLSETISRDGGFIKGMPMKRVVWVVKLIHVLPQLSFGWP